MHGLKQGNEVLAQIHKEMSIENVEKLMSETKEAIAYQQVDLSDLSHIRSLTENDRKLMRCCHPI
jgi:charged multivesicular body protein 6